MTDTVKQETFRSGPLNTKPVSDIPGVGPVLTQKLNKANIYEAKQLYVMLINFKLDEDKFKNWLKGLCPGARAQPCYDALMEWHRQFGEVNPNNGREPIRQKVRESVIRVSKNRANAANRKSSVHFKRASPGIETQLKPDPLTSFFISMADSVRRFPSRFYPKVKSEIFTVVNKYEMVVASEQHAGTVNGDSGRASNSRS